MPLTKIPGCPARSPVAVPTEGVLVESAENIRGPRQGMSRDDGDKRIISSCLGFIPLERRNKGK
jgi:hypothetical protein